MPTICKILPLIFLIACSSLDYNTMFNQLVYTGNMKNISSLKSGKVSCLHCPFFFRFNANSETIKEIIISHNLVEVKEKVDDVEKLNELISRQVDWWLSKNNLKLSRIYGVFYKGKSFSYEPSFRVLIQSGNIVYFISRGHYNPKYYIKYYTKEHS